MPALNPLTGLGGLNPFGGAPASLPVIAYTGADSQAAIVQTVTGSTNVSGPTTFTLAINNTKPGDAVIVFVAVNASAAAALGATPAGWTLLWSQVVATLALGCYVLPGNSNPAGGNISFTLASPTATTGGISGIGYEVANCPFLSDVNSSQTGSSTSPASGAAQLQPPATNNLILGAIAWVLGTASLTVGNTSPAGSIVVTTAQVSSTNGTTNAALEGSAIFQPAQAAGASTGFIIGGTLSVSSVWDAGCINLRSLASDFSVGSEQVDQTRQGPQVIAGGQQAISVGAL